MNARSRASILLAASFALTLPFAAFLLYFTPKFPENQWPTWFTNTLAIWLIGNILIVSLIARNIAKRTKAEQISIPPRKASLKTWIARAVCSYLVILWSVLFVYGVKGTMQGQYPLNSAIPAGAFLLFFILMFGWTVYRSFRPRA